MFLKELKLWNFRQFGDPSTPIQIDKPHLCIELNSGLNALIGANDSGKSSIIDAVKLILDTHSIERNWLDVNDFHDGTDQLRIECRFSGITNEEAQNFTEWLIYPVDTSTGEVSLTVYLEATKDESRVRAFDIRAGLRESGLTLKAGARELLRATYLKPLRDAKSELIPRRNSRLSQILAGHEAFKRNDEPHHFENLVAALNTGLMEYFSVAANGDDSGVNLAAKLNVYLEKFFGQQKKAVFSVSDKKLKDVLEILRLSLESENLGLGSQNLLFVAAELLNLERSGWHGIRLGLIEELEAHLHPQAQLRVVEHLQELADTSGLQFVLTTHSPNLASMIKLKNIHYCIDRKVHSLAEGKTELDPDDYKFLERFLDVTKANLFFANGVVLVEGWAEELILPALATSCGINLTANGTSIINVGSTAMLRYAKILQRADKNESLNVPVAVITDLDILPEDHEQSAEEQSKSIVDKYQSSNSKAFHSPKWTLEYCLLHSKILGSHFEKAVLKVHRKKNNESVSELVERKLRDKSLKKALIAQQFADLLSSQNFKLTDLEKDEYTGYLVKAIRYAGEGDGNQQ